MCERKSVVSSSPHASGYSHHLCPMLPIVDEPGEVAQLLQHCIVDWRCTALLWRQRTSIPFKHSSTSLLLLMNVLVIKKWSVERQVFSSTMNFKLVARTVSSDSFNWRAWLIDCCCAKTGKFALSLSVWHVQEWNKGFFADFIETSPPRLSDMPVHGFGVILLDER